MATTKPKKPRKKAATAASAFHSSTDDGDAIVGVKNLRVLVTDCGDYWFAQGLEIDYAAEGATFAEVKKHFENGLAFTIREHLKTYNSIDKVLTVAPQEAWAAFLQSDEASLRMNHSQTSFHDALCLTGITYIMEAAA